MTSNFAWVSALIFIYSTAFTTGIEVVSSRLSGPVVEGYGEVSGPVMAGRSSSVEWRIAKRTDCPGMISRVWNGEGSYYLVEQSRPTGLPMSNELRTYNIPTFVPETAPPGPLTLEIRGTYNCSGSVRSFVLGPVVMTVVPRPE